MRLAVYCDYTYRVDGDRLYAERAFALFLRELASHCERLVVIGRLDPSPGRYPYLMTGVEFAPLPHYQSGAHFGAVMRALPAGLRRFWRVLSDVDVAWILGPNPPQALAFALLAAMRRRRVVLGVRQNLPELIRHRHKGKWWLEVAAMTLEAAFRLLARVVSVVVVGPDLARRYRAAASLHMTYVSLISEKHIVAPTADQRTYDGSELRILSVGRLDPEKDPLLLADVLERALRSDSRWRLDVCGDGTMLQALARRLEELGIADRARLHGYVAIDDGLWDLYRRSHVLLHVSLTEGAPQVLLEAFASRLPVVATAVGGVPDMLRGRGLLIAPSDADAAAGALQQLATDPELRMRLVEAAAAEARDHTLEAERERLAEFLSANS
ncbi:MAG TPA: glycosyltransferase [Solirubrobacteraceae bacterium]|jgi:glycosyltransferase involved in cell wall biosynthesis|nr:glycosyltransferase [Solirubrobacteraceae bacterium]